MSRFGTSSTSLTKPKHPFHNLLCLPACLLVCQFPRSYYLHSSHAHQEFIWPSNPGLAMGSTWQPEASSLEQSIEHIGRREKRRTQHHLCNSNGTIEPRQPTADEDYNVEEMCGVHLFSSSPHVLSALMLLSRLL